MWEVWPDAGFDRWRPAHGYFVLTFSNNVPCDGTLAL